MVLKSDTPIPCRNKILAKYTKGYLGSRALMVEIQALVTPTNAAIIIAVLEKKCGLHLKGNKKSLSGDAKNKPINWVGQIQEVLGLVVKI